MSNMDKITGAHLLPDYITPERLRKHWDRAKSGRQRATKLFELLNAFDEGKQWDVLGVKMPPYQLKPNTNWVKKTKNDIVNSVYAGGYVGNVLPIRAEDKETADLLNRYLEYVFDKTDAYLMQLYAGERAALLNIGITQVGWDSTVISGTKDALSKGEVEFKNIDPLSFYCDPSATHPLKGQYIIIAEKMPLTELEAEEQWSDRLKTYRQLYESANRAEEFEKYGLKGDVHPEDDTVSLMTYYIRKVNEKGGVKIDQIITIGGDFILEVKENIKPNTYPFAILYSNLPTKDLYGISTPHDIMSLQLAVNMIDSIEATHAYKTQNPAKLIDKASGINVRSFAKHGNDPDKVWVVNGNPSEVIRYVQPYQLSPTLPQLQARFTQMIPTITELDAAYLGRDTGSIQTTGGVEGQMARVSMSDNTRVALLEDYVKQMTKLVIQYYKEFGDKRWFRYNLSPDSSEVDFVSIDFEEMDTGVEFDYTVHVSPQLPKNKARMAEWANIIMEKQMQYQPEIQLMSPTEWLSYQDAPQKHIIYNRIKAEEQQNTMDEILGTIGGFAAMYQQGLSPEDSVQILAEEKEMMKRGNPLGNTANANSFQQRQM